MAFAERYIRNNIYQKLKFTRAPMGLLHYIIIIPAFSEQEIFQTLQSLKNCSPSKYPAEVFILVNYPENISKDIKVTNIDLFHNISRWCSENSNEYLGFFCFLAENLPRKFAGAGLARKIAMDAALERFNSLNQPNGFIISLDADTLVPSNYLVQIENTLHKNPNTGCLIFNFAHPDSGNEYMPKIYRGAVLYEMYLRYLKLMLKKTGFPYYHHTIGSCFAVKASIYAKVGGMNRRKGGEDFYFLHKVFPVANTQYIKNLILFPSCRPSWRVPFGTGPAIRQMAAQPEMEYLTYNPESFSDIAKLIALLPYIFSLDELKLNEFTFQLPDSLKTFLMDNDGLLRISEIKKNCASKSSFIKRFYTWFDAFMIIKYLNFVKDKVYNPLSVVTAIKNTFLIHLPNINALSEIDLLNKLREMDLQE